MSRLTLRPTRSVVALKSRTVPVMVAVQESLAALRWLQAQGAQQIYFKYCSTFDSTAQGNIGPGHRGPDGRAGRPAGR